MELQPRKSWGVIQYFSSDNKFTDLLLSANALLKLGETTTKQTETTSTIKDWELWVCLKTEASFRQNAKV